MSCIVEIETILHDHGYDARDAGRLLAADMSPEELRQRVTSCPGAGPGSIAQTHRIGLTPELATLEVARQLVQTERALGRLFLAGAATVLRYHHGLAVASRRTDVLGVRQAARCTRWADAFEAEQRALGFGVGPEELAAAEGVVEPEPVESWTDQPLGAAIAAFFEAETSAPVRNNHVHVLAESRRKGAYLTATIQADPAYLYLARPVDGPGAHAAAVLFVGRWARVGRAVLATMRATR